MYVRTVITIMLLRTEIWFSKVGVFEREGEREREAYKVARFILMETTEYLPDPVQSTLAT